MAEIDLKARAASLTCPYCHGALLQGGLVWGCPSCTTLHHRECVEEYGKCTVLGCREPFEPTKGVVFLASPPPSANGFAAVAALLVALLVFGGAAYAVVRSALPVGVRTLPAPPRPSGPAPAPAPAPEGTFPRGHLEGPGGSVTFPLGKPAIVNVWLQGCGDCMPAFETWRGMKGTRHRVPVVNVAYGSGTLDWAESYGVGENLVNDPGGAGVVRPLGIGTFTTYVLEADGRIRWTGHPAQPGFADQLAAAVDALEAELR